MSLKYQDTQCGFKMFRRTAAEALFALCEEPRYLFDVELLWWAERLGYHDGSVQLANYDEEPRVTVISWTGGSRRSPNVSGSGVH